MLDRLRMTWRMQRWELAVLVGVPVALAAGLFALGMASDAVSHGLQACWRDDPGARTVECRSLVDWGNALQVATGTLPQAVGFVPFAAGILLGAPLIARELEHRTALMAWSLAPSRLEWLVGRVLPVGLLLAASLLLLGHANEVLLGTMTDAELGFRQFGQFGAIVVARGLGVFVLAMTIGLVVGRVLPGILLSAGLTIAFMLLVTLGMSQLQRSEAEWQVAANTDWDVVHMVYDSGFLSEETGEIISWEQAYERFPERLDAMTDMADAPAGWISVSKHLDPDSFDRYLMLESGAFGFLLLAAGLLAAAMVRTRRAE